MASAQIDAVWSPSFLELATALSLAPLADVRRRTAEICGAIPRPPEERVRPEMFRLAALLLRRAAHEHAAALGATELELLQFDSPQCKDLAFAGSVGSKRRLDRVMGGGPLVVYEARQPLHLKWLGPGMGRFYVLRGEAWVNERKARASETLVAQINATVHLAGGAHVLVRNPAPLTILEIAHNAGLDVDQLTAQALSRDIAVETALGPLALNDGRADLAGRSLHLSAAEAALLRELALADGAVMPRADLARAAKLKSERSLEHALVQLRDKLGDGLITTVYGAGCALEIKPKS
jgi:hypothetical protein